MEYLYYTILGIVSYFIGNISFARIISKVKHGDITKSGSGNPGTLNVWRAFGFWSGIFTFVFDMLKGLVPCLIAYFTFGLLGCNPEIAIYIAGFSVILGHIFPVVYKFKGGKGIATAIGVFFAVNWWVTLIVFLVMIISMLFIKYASICTLGMIIIMSVVEICLCNPANWVNYIFIAGILLLILFAHRGNIKRLFTGKENKTELLAMVKEIASQKKNRMKEKNEHNKEKHIKPTTTSTDIE